jgi:hypothetical protein
MRLVQSVPLIVMAASLWSASGAHAETRGYVVSKFFPAAHSLDGDCAGGINLNAGDQYDLGLVAAGYDEQQVAEWAAKSDDKGSVAINYNDERSRAIRDRAMINGKRVSAWVNPQATPDPNLSMVTGKFALGFNLDGKGGPDGFENPVTGEKGVDNQLFRALGCFTSFRGTETERPAAYSYMWDIVSAAMPAWLMSITTDDFSKDGPATVSFYRAREHVERDANSDVLPDLTFRIDPDPRSHVTFKGEIKNRVLTISEHGKLHAVWGEQVLLPDLRLSKTHLRVRLDDDGSVAAVIGGYQPWKEALSDGFFSAMAADWVGLYHNIRKAADANPDPKTGINQDISVAYRIDAVPAFLVESPN